MPFAKHIVSTNISITQHAKNGNLKIARELLDEMPRRTVVSWNAMISGYSNWGRYKEALNLVSVMDCSIMRLNETTFSTPVSVCARLGNLCDGKQIHCLVLKTERFELVGSALLYFYSTCYEIGEAKRVFDELREWNGLVWSLMLVGTGYVQCNLLSEAMDVFL